MIKLKSLLEIKEKIPVPAEPGTTPIPANHLRLYHYTHSDPDIIRREGLKISSTQGHTYGEPDAVWCSLQQPGNYKNFVEFSMAIDDPRFSKIGASPDPNYGVEFYQGRGNDFTIFGDVKPSEFIAVHEPWHHHYRYMVENDLAPDILAGKYDDLTADKFPNEYKALVAIKHNFGNDKV